MILLRTTLLTLSLLVGSSLALAETRSFTAVSVEIDGTKFWLPSSFTVKKGDKVKFKIVSKVPGTNSIHGFTIKDFNVVETADTKGKDIEFIADKSGIFPLQCHLHPAHVGAQLIVLE